MATQKFTSGLVQPWQNVAKVQKKFRKNNSTKKTNKPEVLWPPNPSPWERRSTELFAKFPNIVGI